MKDRCCRFPAAWIALFGVVGCSSASGVGAGGLGSKSDLQTTVTFDIAQAKSDIVADLGGGLSDAAGDVWTFGEVAPLSGEFGAPCSIGGDCDSGYCVPTPSGSVCSKACNDVCPEGFKCAPYNPQGGDVNYVCVAGYGTLCDPCASNADCNSAGDQGNVCVSFGPDGSFCGAVCAGGKSCAPGYDCQTVLDAVSGKQVKQCVFAQGACPCSQAAIAAELKTACQNKNLYGACEGVRKCTAQGLTECQAAVPKPEECNNLDDDCNGKTDDFDVTAQCKKSNAFGTCTGILSACVNGQPQCDAPEAAPETCNGLDDNCNGETDEGNCDDGEPCTKDTCNTDGSCKHVAQSGAPCDDGNACTAADQCSQGTCMGGKPLDCNDDDACSADSCDALSGCLHTAQEGSCIDDGNACTQDLCIAGKCTHPAAATGSACLEDGDPCTQDVCMGGACTHPPAAFAVPCTDDGNACTADVCNKGACAHMPLGSEKSCPEDGDPCTQDVCLAGKCSHPPAANNGPCSSDGVLCTDDICQGGKCTHPNADLKPCLEDGNVCTQDVCDGGSCAHPPKAGSPPCDDDGLVCTNDKCSFGLCSHPPNNAGCDDGDPCTLTDLCNMGDCKGYNQPDCDDGNGCTADKCQKGQGCVHTALDGNFCTDGNKCTTNDQCIGGQCVGVGDKSCDDGNSCTTDNCDGGSGCTHTPASGGCTNDGNPCSLDLCVGGTCTHDAAPGGSACGNSSDPCLAGACQGTNCQQVPTSNVCNDGNACTSSDTCSGGVCSGQAFKDCNDGDPCTQDSCDGMGSCTHTASSGASCVAASSDCPVGVCNGGTCLSKPGVTCQATYSADLCSDVSVPGTCSGNGSCVASSAPPGYTCPGCNGICLKCLIFQVCIPLF